MRRRDLLSGGLAAGALSMGTTATASSTDPIALCFQQIDLQIERAAERVRPFMTATPGFPAGEDISAALYQAVDALAHYGGLSTLTPEQQAEARVQTRMWGAAENMASSLNSLATAIEQIDDDTLEHLHRTLEDRPELIEAALHTMEQESAELDIPKGVRKQLLRTARETGFDMARGQRSGATRRHLARFRRLQRRVEESDDPMQMLTADGTVQEQPASAGSPPSLEPVSTSNAGKKVLGAMMLAMGVTNSAVYIFAVGGSFGWAVLCVCVAIPMLACILFLFIAGASLMVDKPSKP